MTARPRLERTTVGTAPARAGQPEAAVDAYTLETGTGFAITAWSYGATLVEVLAADRFGRRANVCLRLPDLDAYLDRARNPYVGATVGRYCRCVAGAEFVIDGVRHRLARNEGPHHVHGGPEGLDRRVWSAEAARDGDALEVRFTVTSPDGDQGYPGELTVQTAYRAEPDGSLVITHVASTTAPTAVGLTNHAFWNLAGEGTVDGHRLHLRATEAVRFDEHLIPLPGPPEAVAGTARDFTVDRPLDGVRVDNCFVVPDRRVLATLTHPGSGRVMRVSTDQPAVGVYTGDWFTGRPRGGICLETGAFPDAPNRPDYPSARLDPGESCRHRTTHRFEAAEPVR
ncbi:aldose epimerase family protein [Amycolatopsis jiangsuensis]|uniref:Aldose 1-epimerase n=1 Tax=Amycolatopsis jiangsuensis TaxID=1181879 RepID=A0A840J1A4_9PSEU|nr:aldose epimerase family protein [Amycolatopsis jiangsuensis]MBB4688776.1 aldose 1-epimerase [Amycolatopsis jiangsuensis]